MLKTDSFPLPSAILLPRNICLYRNSSFCCRDSDVSESLLSSAFIQRYFEIVISLVNGPSSSGTGDHVLYCFWSVTWERGNIFFKLNAFIATNFHFSNRLWHISVLLVVMLWKPRSWVHQHPWLYPIPSLFI